MKTKNLSWFDYVLIGILVITFIPQITISNTSIYRVLIAMVIWQNLKFKEVKVEK